MMMIIVSDRYDDNDDSVNNHDTVDKNDDYDGNNQ